MQKSKLLFVDLNDSKLKSVGETITSDTSRKILNYLGTEKEATESAIAAGLELPLSTVHYHLQKLQQAGLVGVDEFHYSSKGREVNHYKLASQYIVIGPARSGLAARLSAVLPLVLISVAVAGIVKVVEFFGVFGGAPSAAMGKGMESTALDVASPMVASKAAPVVASVSVLGGDVALLVLIGSLGVVGVYSVLMVVLDKMKKE